MKFNILILFSVLIFEVRAQNLHEQRIRPIPSGQNMSAVFLDQGIFQKGSGTSQSQLLQTRHDFKKNENFERIVFDFSTNKVPKTYAYASGQKVFIDFFDTSLGATIGSAGKAEYLKAIDYFPLTEDQLSVELNFKKQVSVRLFFLEDESQKARLVLDVKE